MRLGIGVGDGGWAHDRNGDDGGIVIGAVQTATVRCAEKRRSVLGDGVSRSGMGKEALLAARTELGLMTTLPW